MLGGNIGVSLQVKSTTLCVERRHKMCTSQIHVRIYKYYRRQVILQKCSSVYIGLADTEESGAFLCSTLFTQHQLTCRASLATQDNAVAERRVELEVGARREVVVHVPVAQGIPHGGDGGLRVCGPIQRDHGRLHHDAAELRVGAHRFLHRHRAQAEERVVQ